MRATLVLSTVILLGASLPAHTADWACGAIGSNGHGVGWKVSPAKSEASAGALSQCRSSGGSGCFVTGCNCVEASTEDTSCVGQSASEAELRSPQTPPSNIPPHVFNNIPPRYIDNTERPQVSNRPVTAAKPQNPGRVPNGAAPSRPSNERTATQGPMGGVCDQGDQLLPTGKRIVVNPCSIQKPPPLYLPPQVGGPIYGVKP